MATKPEFVTIDAEAILAAWVADYETRSGKKLQPGQPEYGILSSGAYRETLILNKVQEAAVLNLVEFSRAPVLDYLGTLVGVTRLPSAFAGCTLEFTLVEGHAQVVIPEGTRVSSADGLGIFQTLEDTTVEVGVDTVEIQAEALTAGIVGNGYVAGLVKDLLDPLAFVESVANIDTTAGGSEQESDDGLRERIKLAPGSYSTAGSVAAYKYWARTAHPSIVDVEILSLIPGDVNVYVITENDDETPGSVLDAVEAILSAETVRPICDNVLVEAGAVQNYTLDVDVILFTSADQADAVARIEAALLDYSTTKRMKLGNDIIESQIIATAMGDRTEVYSASIAGWTDLISDETQYPRCVGITVNVTDTVDD
jgi:phage-related baseplate assembly protein